MYIKRIILATAILGLIGMGIFSYYIYNIIFAPNTAFQQDYVYVHIKSDADYQEVFNELKPLLKKPDNFSIVAQKKSYINNIDPGRYKIKKGMNNNQIINALRSTNIPLPVVFNNEHRLPELAKNISTQLEADSLSLIQAMTDSTFLSTT